MFSPSLIPAHHHLGGIFGSYEGLAAIALAAQHLNTGDGSIVPEVAGLANNKCGIHFNVAAYDTEQTISVAMDKIIQITDRTRNDEADNVLPCVILGAARSAVTMPTSIISGSRGFPQISPLAVSSGWMTNLNTNISHERYQVTKAHRCHLLQNLIPAVTMMIFLLVLEGMAPSHGECSS